MDNNQIAETVKMNLTEIKEIKMKNIHLLPTNLSRLYYTISMSGYNLKLSERPISKSSEVRPQHIYITSDEEIEEGNWRFDLKDNDFYKTTISELGEIHNCKKIILTTDQDLIKNGVQAIDDEFLEWFVSNPSCEEVSIEEEDYSQKCKECGEIVKRGYSCNKGCFMKSGNFIPTDENSKYKIIIPKEEPKDVVLGYKTSLDAQMLDKIEPKQETLEEAAKEFVLSHDFSLLTNPNHLANRCFQYGAKWHQERMYSEEDMKIAWTNGNNYHRGSLIEASGFTFERTIEQLKKQ